jgi:hypothetical protein
MGRDSANHMAAGRESSKRTKTTGPASRCSVDDRAHDSCPRRLLALLKLFVEHAPDDAGIGYLGVSNDAGFVDVLRRESKVLECRFKFIGEPTLGQALDFESICHDSVGSSVFKGECMESDDRVDQFVVIRVEDTESHLGLPPVQHHVDG